MNTRLVVVKPNLLTGGRERERSGGSVGGIDSWNVLAVKMIINNFIVLEHSSRQCLPERIVRLPLWPVG